MEAKISCLSCSKSPSCQEDLPCRFVLLCCTAVSFLKGRAASPHRGYHASVIKQSVEFPHTATLMAVHE